MSAPFYADPENLAKLKAEWPRWLGTPFCEGSAVPGPRGGVDCIGLVEAISIACGACKKLSYKRVSLDWCKHHATSPIVDFLKANKDSVQMLDPESERMTGDILTVKTGQGVHHVGIWLDDAQGQHLLHVPIGGVVQRWSINAGGLKGKISGVWRIQK